ncbi:MAG: sigma-70 family RNA polymerase sigma factor [Lachnospiraceae bacterium]|jgi:RNA polymerase sigma-70 factor (ECF subfamily)|nr:sigma-70 family RNA polymerase sigma factor [Lachnospiraceae bacterium]MBQ2576083.1 sigma-70 family RNA polymerase sigma factor [Lachnospiraceae bacterium]
MNAEQIVRKYSDMVYGIAIRYVRNRIDADDVYNDVFYRYFRRERTFASEEHRKNWLIRVSVNAAKDFLIKKRSDVELRDDMFEDVRSDSSNVSREELMDLRDGLKKLKEEYREIIELYYINGFNTKEISVMLQKSENTVKSQLLRGRQKLRELIE